MNDQIICPNCKKPIPLSQALSHQIKERLKEENRLEIDEEKKKLNLEAQKWRQEQLKKIEDKVKNEIDFKLKNVQGESDDLKKQNKTLQEQLLELNRLIRQLKTENDQKRLDLEKQLINEQEKIRQDEEKRISEEYKLKILEKDKKLSDAMKMVDDYKRKLEQGSQQLQGEVLELELKNILQKEFTYDEIKDVPKGVKGADLIQIVKNDLGKVCGTIIWESKRTKVWSQGWIAKLKEDQRRIKSEIAVIISQSLPEGVQHFSEKDGVWIGNYDTIISLGTVLRKSLIDLAGVKASLVGKHDKKEILWNYLTSIEFKQRLEAFYDAYTQIKEDLKKEQEWFRRKWAKQDKNIEQLSESILGMHGDMQGIIGRSLPEIKALEMLPSGDKNAGDKLF